MPFAAARQRLQCRSFYRAAAALPLATSWPCRDVTSPYGCWRSPDTTAWVQTSVCFLSFADSCVLPLPLIRERLLDLQISLTLPLAYALNALARRFRRACFLRFAPTCQGESCSCDDEHVLMSRRLTSLNLSMMSTFSMIWPNGLPEQHQVSHGLQLQPQWRTPTAAVS